MPAVNGTRLSACIVGFVGARPLNRMPAWSVLGALVFNRLWRRIPDTLAIQHSSFRTAAAGTFAQSRQNVGAPSNELLQRSGRLMKSTATRFNRMPLMPGTNGTPLSPSVPSFSVPSSRIVNRKITSAKIAFAPRTSPKGAAYHSPGLAEPKRGNPGLSQANRKANRALLKHPAFASSLSSVVNRRPPCAKIASSPRTSPKGAADYSPGLAEPRRGNPGLSQANREANPALLTHPAFASSVCNMPRRTLAAEHRLQPR
jgi:hypothetical protein